MTHAARSPTCPRCGAALGGATNICPSCLGQLVDPWGRFELLVRGGIIILCVCGALYLAGMTVSRWIASSH